MRVAEALEFIEDFTDRIQIQRFDKPGIGFQLNLAGFRQRLDSIDGLTSRDVEFEPTGDLRSDAASNPFISLLHCASEASGVSRSRPLLTR